MALPYQYSTLSPAASTRILELQPCDQQDGPLQCKLREINIESDPFYEALSYTWGKPEFTEPLIIDDGFVINITPNLRDALLRFRSRLNVRRLWVDAICINQQDDEDKTKQIPLMTEIYKCCSGVVVWLGNDSHGSSSMDAVNAYSRQIDHQEDERVIQEDIESLVRLPWFGRRWIVQEVVLNPNVTLFCGGSQIPWLRLLQVVRSSQNTSGLLSVVKTMESIWIYHCLGIEASSQAPLRLLDLLSSLSELGCVDARDRIYALAGLASDTFLTQAGEVSRDPREIRINVSYNQPAENLYMDLITMNFRCFDYRDLLKHSDLRADGSHLGGLCSWIPDWRLPVVRQPLSGGWNLEGSPKVSLVAASGALQIEFRKKQDDQGYMILGSIEKISSVFPIHASQSAIMSWLREVWSLLLSWASDITFRSARGQLIHQLGMIFFQDHMKDEWSKAVANYDWQMYYFKGYAEFTKMILEESDYSEDEKLFALLKRTMEGRQLFLMSSKPGRSSTSGNELASISTLERPTIGIGPSHARPGDLICTRGISIKTWADCTHECTADSTFLLRETDDGVTQDNFFYIGEARANRRHARDGTLWNAGPRLHSIILC
ncbi:heterokaryon incompatibility domain-containing protein [Trichoderma barbatum]